MNISSVVKAGILVTILLFIYSLFDRAPDTDDAWIGEQAYWMSKLGYVKSELMRGITMQEVRLICHHKLLTLHGALFIHLFGFSLATLKAVSLLYLLLFIGVFTYHTYNKVLSPEAFYLALLLLLSNALVFQYAFVFRPEIMVMTLGFISYTFLSKALQEDRRNYSALLLSGLFAGLCVAAHLNGIIFPVAGFLLLIWNRKVTGSLLFGLATLPTIAIYFYDFTPEFNFKFWHYQLFENPYFDAKRKLPYGLSYLLNIVTEQKRFFHSLKEISFSVLFLVAFSVAYSHLKAHRNLMRYLGLLVLFLALVSMHKTPKYLLLTLPYFLLLLVLALRHLYHCARAEQVIAGKFTYKKLLPALSFLLVVYLLVNTFYNLYTVREESVIARNNRIARQYIRGDAQQYRIVAPMSFIFNQIDDFEAIQSEMVYGEKQKTNEALKKEKFLNLTGKYGIDYIILSKEYIDKLEMQELTEKEIRNQDFELLTSSQNLMVLKRR
ncbi:ArnT family glycosyltransferase [Botryobacter ruber]|uniref:ArnT family glycosyltransferase n=1 Tax=Botryobacter ruber TaxID=2171629 RepID=UPI000E0C90F8|nr:glycosyltransferase family 39 protein [Botryobacter ruber]